MDMWVWFVILVIGIIAILVYDYFRVKRNVDNKHNQEIDFLEEEVCKDNPETIVSIESDDVKEVNVEMEETK